MLLALGSHPCSAGHIPATDHRSMDAIRPADIRPVYCGAAGRDMVTPSLCCAHRQSGFHVRFASDEVFTLAAAGPEDLAGCFCDDSNLVRGLACCIGHPSFAS